MVVDFSKITIYEAIALILSFIAIIIPFIKWLWDKWFVKPVLNHLPTGNINPFFNKSGSYLKIESVYEALNKPIIVKKIAIRVTCVQNEKKLNENWLSFWSPVTLSSKDNFSSSTETAHPFRIEKNSLTTAFIEFEAPQSLLGRKLAQYNKSVEAFVKKQLIDNLEYDNVVKELKSQPFYNSMRNDLLHEFFWEIGSYKIEIIVKYDENEKKFHECFKIDETAHDKLMHNLDEVLLEKIKMNYNIPFDYCFVVVKLDSFA